MASFSLAFHGFMRVGEITVDCKNKQMHTEKFENIKLCDARLEVLLTSSKTDQFGSGTTIVISKQKNKNVCPVQIMANFIKVRPPYLGPLFCHFDGSPLQDTGHATVWIVGSSIIKHAFGEARGRPGGVNLGLQRMGVNIWWQGKCGGKVLDMKQQIRTMLKYEDPPTILVLHIGGNDIGEKSSKTLCELIRKQFSWMRQLMLDTVFVWSQIIPRSSWRYSDNINAMEKCRMRVNTSIASFLTKTDGCYLRYPDIKANELFLMKDGVHLTSLGNNIFLNTLQGGLEMIIRNLGINLTFPDFQRSISTILYNSSTKYINYTIQQFNEVYQLYYTTVQRSISTILYNSSTKYINYTIQQFNEEYHINYTTDQRSNQLYYTTDQRSNQLYYTTDQRSNQLYYTTDQRSNQLYYTTDQRSNQLYYTTVQRSNQLNYTTDQRSNQLYYTTDQRSNQLYYTTDQRSNQLYYTTDQRSNQLYYTTDQRSNQLYYTTDQRSNQLYNRSTK
ncbi:unnamed protein product [Mytilus edulis]|uniref:SGNH hydrolase-type esterase domain-containing protein n=1 Tax=Mytilus edulis TaxID=6550 RepID=A0A8S3PN08_MYTED|nr:unnamed protein product [Mytilus edulis]